MSCVYPARSDTRRVLLFGVTSGNRAKRGYTPTEFRDVGLKSEPKAIVLPS
nr:MAG TPA: hypothetical protein [Microviridae sp.]